MPPALIIGSITASNMLIQKMSWESMSVSRPTRRHINSTPLSLFPDKIHHQAIISDILTRMNHGVHTHFVTKTSTPMWTQRLPVLWRMFKILLLRKGSAKEEAGEPDHCPKPKD